MEKFNYLYLIQTGEDLKTNIYKIGKTEKTLEQRLKGYDIKSYMIRSSLVDDCHKREVELLEIFNHRFKLNRGKEYFEGDINDMILEFNNFCDKFKINIKIQDDDIFINEIKPHINNKIDINNNFKCKKCKQEYSSLQALERHLNKKFKCDMITKFQCKICKKSFIYNKNLNEHYEKTSCTKINNNDNINKAIIDILKNNIELEDKLFFLKNFNIILKNDEIIKIINSTFDINTKVTLLTTKK